MAAAVLGVGTGGVGVTLAVSGEANQASASEADLADHAALSRNLERVAIAIALPSPTGVAMPEGLPNWAAEKRSLSKAG